ncbi:MAG: hypothetical protein WD990_10790 [Acidimicrobiia bacterium]
MGAAIVVYIGIGVVVGLLARFTTSETSSLAGVAGSGGAAGLIGGVVGNLLFSDEIAIDAPGLVGAAVLAIVAVLVVRVADRRQLAEAHAEAHRTDTAAAEPDTTGTETIED